MFLLFIDSCTIVKGPTQPSCNFDTIFIDSTVAVKENRVVVMLTLWFGVGQLNIWQIHDVVLWDQDWEH